MRHVQQTGNALGIDMGHWESSREPIPSLPQYLHGSWLTVRGGLFLPRVTAFKSSDLAFIAATKVPDASTIGMVRR